MLSFVVPVIVRKDKISIVNFYTLQGDGTKISPQESMRSQYKPNIQVLILADTQNILTHEMTFQAKSSTLPSNSSLPRK